MSPSLISAGQRFAMPLDSGCVPPHNATHKVRERATRAHFSDCRALSTQTNRSTPHASQQAQASLLFDEARTHAGVDLDWRTSLTRAAQPSHAITAQYTDYQRRRGYTNATIRQRHRLLSTWSYWLSRRTPPTHILDATTQDAVAWLESLRSTTTDFTRGLYTSGLNAFYTWAERADLISTNPMNKVERPKPISRLPRPADDDELARCLDYARTNDLRMACWICLGAYQGFRCIEIARLTVADIDRRNMALRAFGKGNKERIVPLHRETFKALIRYGIPASGYVFTKENGTSQGLTPGTISSYGGRFFKALGSDIRMHQLRHWYGTKVNASADLLTARELMGHASTATTELYTRVNVDRYAPVVDGLAIS